MNLLEFSARIFVGWLAAAVIVTAAWCIAHARMRARRGTRVALYPPPVPKPRHYEDDLLADAPAEILAVDERDRQFFAIVNAERWFADGAA